MEAHRGDANALDAVAALHQQPCADPEPVVDEVGVRVDDHLAAVAVGASDAPDDSAVVPFGGGHLALRGLADFERRVEVVKIRP